jgi:membrane-bound lytic murein transglycosylase MltF
MATRHALVGKILLWIAIVLLSLSSVMVTVKCAEHSDVIGVARAAAQPQEAESAHALALKPQKFTVDFDAMFKRRYIRVVVPLSRTLYFNDHGHEGGFTAENVRAFERHLNRKFAKKLGKRPITLLVGPRTRDKMLQYVVDGRADIAAGNITVTDARRKIVDFVVPSNPHRFTEIVLTRQGVAPLDSAEQLAGRTVHVRKASSYYDSLNMLNDRLKKAGKRPVKLVLVPDELEDEDMMEMLNAGLLEAMVCDDWKARIWKQILPKINLNEQAVVREGGVVGWAFRKNSPKLAAELKEFSKQITPGKLTVIFKKYYQRIPQIHNSMAAADRKRFEGTIKLFKKYGAKYGFDPLLLAAQGYQESRLRQETRSRVGAVGIMQVMPKTGASLGVGDITRVEPNIHAGVKYLDHLMKRYFADAQFNEQNRTLFAIAAYNAGPGRIAQMQKLAAKRGLDPQQWFNNVEIVTSEQVGMNPTIYVRNIYKYYVAYSYIEEVRERRQKAREAVEKKR